MIHETFYMIIKRLGLKDLLCYVRLGLNILYFIVLYICKKIFILIFCSKVDILIL